MKLTEFRVNAGTKFVSEIVNVWRICEVKVALVYTLHAIVSIPRLLLSKSLASIDAKMVDRLCTFKINSKERVKLKIDQPGNNFGLAREIYGRQVYFAKAKRKIAQGDRVVDLGANVGVFSLLAAKLGARVIAVEATATHVDNLRYHALLNQCEHKIASYQGVVGSRSGVYAQIGNNFSTGKMQELDLTNILIEQGIQSINFLKLDIEGSEFDLFLSRPAWLNKVEQISMEIHPSFGVVSDLVAVLEEVGFEVQIFNRDLLPTTKVCTDFGYLFAYRL